MQHNAAPLDGLRFRRVELPVRIEDEGLPTQQIFATIDGTFSLDGWSLMNPDGEAMVASDRTSQNAAFHTDILLTGTKTPVQLKAISPEGKLQAEDLVIVYPQFVGAALAANEIPSLGHGWVMGLGVTSINYTQTSLPSLSEVALTPKVSYQVPLKNGWDFGANTYMTAAPLSTNQSNMTAYFLGINARFGYKLPFIRSPWTLSVAGGGYFTTMFTSGSSFGFRNMLGPQVFPVLRLSVSKLNSLATYFKYSPVTAIGSLGFGSHSSPRG